MSTALHEIKLQKVFIAIQSNIPLTHRNKNKILGKKRVQLSPNYRCGSRDMAWFWKRYYEERDRMEKRKPVKKKFQVNNLGAALEKAGL